MRRTCLPGVARAATVLVLLLVLPSWWGIVQAQGVAAPPSSLERLLQAARTGDLAGVAAALASGAPIDGGDPKWGETALMRAAAFGQHAAVQALLAVGANPRVESAGRRTALHAAAEGGDVLIIRDLLARGLAVDGGAEPGDTPLMVACAARRPSAIETLVAAGARHESMGSGCGSLADLIGRMLANGTSTRDLPVVRAFIRARSGLDVPGRTEGTPIQVVVARCHHQPDAPAVARLLLDAGVDLEVKTGTGLTVAEELRRRVKGEPRCAATMAEFERRGVRP